MRMNIIFSHTLARLFTNIFEMNIPVITYLSYKIVRNEEIPEGKLHTFYLILVIYTLCI